MMGMLGKNCLTPKRSSKLASSMRASARRNTASYRHELASRSREPIRWNARTRFNVANVRHGRKSNEQLDLGGLQHSRIANQRPGHDAACSLVTALTYSGGVLVGSKALHGSFRVADVDQLVLVGGLENELRSRDRERDRKEIESVYRSTRHHSRVRRTLIMAGMSYEAISSLERCESATVECCEGIVTARRRQPDSANNIPRELPERLLFERNHRGQ